MVTLSFPAGILTRDEIKGRILRLVNGDPDRFIAVYFNDTVTFLP
jgi:hypothetical protein